MIKKIIKSVSVLSIASIVFTGCGYAPFNSIKTTPDLKEETFDDIIAHDSIKKYDNFNKVRYGSQKLYADKENVYLSKSDLIKSEVERDEPPFELINQRIDQMEMKKKPLGDVIELILDETRVSLFIEPNVNLNVPVPVKIFDMNLMEALEHVVKMSGNTIYYDDTRKALIVSAYERKKYFIPSSIFVKREVKVSFGTSSEGGGTINPIFDMNSESTLKLFKDGLNKVGTKSKRINIDPQSGMISIKEKSLYMKEIDTYIEDFVADRIKQYVVELVVVENEINKQDQLGFDIMNILSGKYNLNLSSLAGGTVSSYNDAVSSGGVIFSAPKGYSNINDTSPDNTTNIAYKSLITALKKNNNINIVNKPNVIVQNHSIGYISVGEEKSYIKSVQVTPGETNSDGSRSQDLYQPVIEKYRDGLQFAVRVDSHKYKDFISLSLAPMLTDTVLNKITGKFDSVQLPDRKIRETFAVANVKNGDIIILSGMKSREQIGDRTEPKLFENIPYVKDFFGSKAKTSKNIETTFLVKVNEIKNSRQTNKKLSTKTREILKRMK
jgi:type II secretory pathway component GspD/PulD (secretin)